MADIEQYIHDAPVFATLSEANRRELAGLAEECAWSAEAVVYREGEPGESLHLLVEGAVELRARIAEGIERALLTVRPGSVFGLLEAIDPQPRTVTAVAVSASRTLAFSRSALTGYMERDPATRVGLMQALSSGLARQTRIVGDLLRQNLAWTLEASGAAALNLQHLIKDRARVRIDLINGRQLTGTLLKVEPSNAGHELLVRDDDAVHQFIPYHAVVRIAFDAGETSRSADVMPELT